MKLEIGKSIVYPAIDYFRDFENSTIYYFRVFESLAISKFVSLNFRSL